MKHLGDYDTSKVIYGKFTTFRPSTGAAFTLAGTPALSVYKDNSTAQSTSGVTLTADFDSVTGLNHFAIDTSSDGTFYSADSNFDVVITTGTVDSVSVVGAVVASFTLRKNSGLKATVAGRTLDVSANGEAGLDFGNIGAPAAGAVPVLGIVDNGTAQAATSTTLQLRAAAAFADSELNGAWILITGGTTGGGQVRRIKSYVGSTDTATVDAWTTTPTGTITYVILAAPPLIDANVSQFGGAAGTFSGGRPEVNTTQFNGTNVTASAGRPEVNTTHVAGTAQSAGDIIARLPNATPGATGGLVINGANSGAISFTSGMTVSNAAGSALTLSSGGGNGNGLTASGNGSGDGISASGGATGRGIHAAGGATSGAGILAEATGDNSNGITANGFGSGHGIASTGGATGDGMHAFGGATSGSGLVAEARGGNSNGLQGIGFGSGLDLAADNITAIQAVTAKLDTTLQVQTGSDYQYTANALALAPSGSGPTLTQIVDGVWDEPIAGHLTAGSTGAALNGAGSAGDPWTTPLPGAYGAGTAGFIVGTNLDAQVSAVKAKTDNLPTDPADESLVIAATDAIFNRIGAPAGASVSADIAAVNAKTTNLPTDPADESLIIAATDAIMTRIGAPVGASISADIAGVQSDTNDIQTRLPAALVAGRIDASVGAMAANVLTAAATAADFTTEIQTGLATAAALTTVSGNVTAVKAKTDSLAFTVAGQVDANVQYVNDAAVTGNGQPGTEWGPA